MRIDCHNDTALFLRQHETLASLKDAHLDYDRVYRYLDGAFFAVFVDEKKYVHNTAEEFSSLLDLLTHDLQNLAEGNILLWHQQLKEKNIRTPWALIYMEGAAPLGKNMENLDRFFDMGLRAIGLTWNYDNDYGGGATEGGRLTPLGRKLIAACNKKGILLDVAHSSSQTCADVIRYSSQPVIDSHTVCGGVYGRWPRAISDSEMLMLADCGGVCAITMVPDFLGGRGDLDRICEHVEYAVALVGSEHVAIGSDYDGACLHEECAGLEYRPLLIDRLRQRGMDEVDVRNVDGDSVHRLLKRVLPNKKN